MSGRQLWRYLPALPSSTPPVHQWGTHGYIRRHKHRTRARLSKRALHRQPVAILRIITPRLAR
ncbi:MAG: hypothetical protein K6U12_04565 [Armatimonadetes bacterium]|nr:hypothetical protein [Armatimonadota bacterium]